jgi:hypothetical protein
MNDDISALLNATRAARCSARVVGMETGLTSKVCTGSSAYGQCRFVVFVPVDEA